MRRLVRVKARPGSIYISHGRTVLATARDGMLHDQPGEGLFVDETRLLSRYRYRIDADVPVPNVLSNVAPAPPWLGYYVILAPGVDVGERDKGSGHVPPEAQQTLELRVSRFAGGGLHEDLDLTNFARQATRFRLSVELDADFADLAETDSGHEQRGEVTESDWTDDRIRLACVIENEFEHDGRARDGADRARRRPSPSPALRRRRRTRSGQLISTWLSSRASRGMPASTSVPRSTAGRTRRSTAAGRSA